MKRRIVAPETEVEKMSFDVPSEREHLFTVSDVFTCEDETGAKLRLDPDTVCVKCEVTNGDEEGRTLLKRITIDPDNKAFFATRLFLKVVGLPYKGEIEIDTDDFQSRQFFATVVHNEGNNGKKYANIDQYNFDKLIENDNVSSHKKEPVEEVAWDE